MSTLTGKRALVTGGSRGIGAAIAVALAEDGADVALTYQNSPERAQAVVASIEQLGRRAVAIQADSADPAAIKRSVDEAVGALGGLDILVNNAGIARYSAIADIGVEDIDALLAVNVRGPVLATQAAIPHLGVGGRVITIGSAGADRIVGSPGTVYYMTKSALQSFNRGLAQELGPKDITANLVQPGSTDTDMNPANGESADYQRGLTPLGRFAAPADIAAAVTFLASPGARHVTGTIITVDGGLLT
ncbi:SDR family NAD(P)-dependent oxidoreductase [Mitsuaria sp. 7]|uniref:SDR family NAD(P)-dependent oxidoreductase n=1 Tax=Mitsuaria sp. 7 TaxID=1658665 RepID=UPI0007DD2F24|nr:SDR family oxidoreductase [Mitsuaria sp. 7]ANH67673.1 oxidoreductase [Mitsuaria sp. 7]